MTVFGVIWVIFLLFCSIRKDIKYIVFATLFSTVLQCSNVISVGHVSVGPHIITSICFIIVCFFRIRFIKIRFPSKVEVIAFLLFCVVIISSIYNRSFSRILLKIIQLGSYVISFYLMGKLYKSINKGFILKAFKLITIFVLIMGFIQFISTVGFLPRMTIINELFFNEVSDSVYYWHDGYDRISSTFMEASYCGCFLVGAFYYFISIWDKGQKNILIILLLGIEILLTKSSTTYVAVAICGLVFVFTSKNKKVKRIFIPISILIVLYLFKFSYSTLDTVIFSKNTSGSAITRYYWNLNAINAFNQSKFIGLGYRSVRGSSIIYSILGELGVIGLVTYCLLNISIIFPILRRRTYEDMSKSGFRFSILAVIISQAVACPDLDLCVYWLFMYLLALCGLRKKKKSASLQEGEYVY